MLEKLRSKFATEKTNTFLIRAIMILVFLFAFSIPSFGGRYPFNLIMYGIMALLAGSSISYSILFKKYFNYKNWCIYLIPLFAIFAFIGTAIYSHSFGNWVSLLLLSVVFFVLLLSFKIIGDKGIISLLLSLGIFAFSLYFIIHYRSDILNFSNFGNEGFRLGFYFDNPNAISAICIVGLSASLYLFLFHESKLRYFMVVPFLLISLIGITTGSRTFIVAFVVVILTMLFFRFKKHKLLYLVIVVSLIILFIVLINLPFAYTIKQRFERFFNTLFTDTTRVDTSTIERVVWFDYGFTLGFKNIITGYGVDGFAIYSGVGTYAHSNLSEVVCDFGIIGTFIFYAPLVALLFNCIRMKKKIISYIFPIFAYYIFVSFSNVFYYNKFYYFNLAFMYFLVFEDFENKVVIKNLGEHVRHIAFTCESMESGGAEKVIATLSNSFADCGYKVTIIGVATNNGDSFYPLNRGVNYVCLQNGDKRIRGFKRIRAINHLLKEIEPDVVISFLPHVIVYTYFSMHGVKAPLIVSERNDPNSDPKEKLLRLLKRYAFFNADGCVFQTEDAKLCYSTRTQKKSVVIHNPIKVDVDAQEHVFRSNRIISVGRLISQKNYRCLIDAFELFDKKKDGYTLTIYGDGPLKEELLTYIASKGLSTKINLAGLSSSWQKDDCNAAMFVSSSDFEGMPNALAEASCLGIPCVATDCRIGGSKEIVTNGINGFLAEVNNPYSLCNAMIEATTLKPHIGYINDFKEKHSPDYISNKWLNYIKGLIESRLSR